ncbi:unsaturated rhamnogalacturonyl hydrolase [Haloferula luteola]|uniref:Unsaturated rhamnogalacturonyl hydrolase n=1 Tax=Haloferula luteola TaxID=595692 RepID=A0A840VDQ4_9BACT|nr:glycoside hydrolase family 28 protein [Haloferula luteola]MBB5353644.1 unsaturated rhamnogalacturonyl hydrolase [Haloferula luteola]
MKARLIALLLALTSSTALSALISPGWQDIDPILKRIQAPSFPNRDFTITDFGAQPHAPATQAIRDAVEACHQAGGGRVIIPPGRWLTAAVILRSNVNLHLVQGATLEWNFDLDDYPLVLTRFEGMDCMNYSPLIYAIDQENIAITGQGTLDGGATHKTWWAWNPNDPKLRKKGPSLQSKDREALGAMMAEDCPVEQRTFGKGHHLRPSFIQTYRCKNILIEGVTLIRSPMWEIHPVFSENITVRGVTITSHGPNNDGCDPESCRDVLVEDTVFDTGDDCIAIKSGRNDDGRRTGIPSENIIIRRCTMKDGHGGVVLGSECSGHIRNVWIEDCVMDSPQLVRSLRFKNNAIRGGILENVFMRNVEIGQVSEAVLTIDFLYEEGANGPYPPIARNIHLENITSSASPRVLFIRGIPNSIIGPIHIRNSRFQGVTQSDRVEHAGSITFDHVEVVPALSP